MPSIVEFQKKLLTDKTARAEFAANPKRFLDGFGIKLPAGMAAPDKIDPALVESSVSHVADALREEGRTIDQVDRHDTNSVVHVIEDVVPTRTRDLVAAKAIHTSMGNPGDAATIAVVGAVVAAVVAVPVAVYGRSADAVTRINPALGIEKVSRGMLGITVSGPNGLRVEGMSVPQVAELIKTIR